MDKISLNDNCKAIINAIKNDTYEEKIADSEDINLLHTLGLIDVISTKDGDMVDGLTDKGRAYLHSNPTLENPSIWDDKKYWINTAISFAALIVSIIAIFITLSKTNE
jgi:hypothetical protein